MSAEVKKELVKLLHSEDVKYLNTAIHNINRSIRRYGAVSEYWDISDPRDIEQHEFVFDDDITVIPIDTAINNLIEYKDVGFTHVGYDAYDDALVAIRHNIQSPSDRAREIYNTIDSEIAKIKRNEMTNEKRLAKIEDLKKQIEKLENEMDITKEDLNYNDYETD